MSSESQYAKFTPKEREEMQELEHTLQSHDASKIEKEIAQAKLDNLKQSKQPPPHNHKHRLHRAEDMEQLKGGSNVFHNDEAFERFEMGGSDNATAQHRGSKVRNQEAAHTQSVKMNHKVRGGMKEKMEEDLLNEDIHSHIRG